MKTTYSYIMLYHVISTINRSEIAGMFTNFAISKKTGGPFKLQAPMADGIANREANDHPRDLGV